MKPKEPDQPIIETAQPSFEKIKTYDHYMEEFISADVARKALQTAETVAIADREDLETLVLDPYQIYHQIHPEYVSSNTPEHRRAFVSELLKRNPTLAYIYHMELSLHSIKFLQLVEELAEKNMIFEGPFLDVGCGPGHMDWWFMERNLLPRGSIALVDIDPQFMQYAETLMTKASTEERHRDKHKFHFFQSDATKIAELAKQHSLKFNTAYSCLVLQWVDDPKAVIEAIYESLRPAGRFFLIGEVPDNVTSTTSISQIKGESINDCDIGFQHGKPLKDIVQICEQTGFRQQRVVEKTMGWAPDSTMETLLEALQQGLCNNYSMEDIMTIKFLIDNYHKAFLHVFIKPWSFTE